MRIAAIAAVALFWSTPIHAEEVIPDPEALICPPSRGDMEYGINRLMTAGGFQEWAGPMSWRRRAPGPFHIPSMAPAEYLHVTYNTFRTSEGTRIIAELRWRTRSYEFGVKDERIAEVFQGVLDEIVKIWPC